MKRCRAPRQRFGGRGVRNVLQEGEQGTRAWILAQTALLHPYGHYYEARVAAGLWGARSP